MLPRAAAGCVDEGKVAAIGGSHGGLLTGHLVGQYPDRFRCGLMRNPVLDISAMIHMTDIPDWCYVECYGSQVGLPAHSCRWRCTVLNMDMQWSSAGLAYFW